MVRRIHRSCQVQIVAHFPTLGRLSDCRFLYLLECHILPCNPNIIKTLCTTPLKKIQDAISSGVLMLKWCILNSHNSHSRFHFLLTWYLGLPLRYRIQLPSLREELKCLRRSPMLRLWRERGSTRSLLLYHLRRGKLHDQNIL